MNTVLLYHVPESIWWFFFSFKVLLQTNIFQFLGVVLNVNVFICLFLILVGYLYLFFRDVGGVGGLMKMSVDIYPRNSAWNCLTSGVFFSTFFFFLAFEDIFAPDLFFFTLRHIEIASLWGGVFAPKILKHFFFPSCNFRLSFFHPTFFVLFYWKLW